MNAFSIIRKSLVAATAAAAVLSAGAASAERFGRDSVYASPTAVTSSPSREAVSQRQGRSSVYAGDVATSPRATAKVRLTPHVAGNGRGSVFAWSNGRQG